VSAGAPLRAVVVTRDEPADGPLSRELKELGLTVLAWPAVSVTRTDPAALRAALTAGGFDWMVFASRHAVAAVLAELAQAPAGVKIAAIGRATAQVLRQRGWPVDLVPEEASAAALVQAFAARPELTGGALRVLYPASSRALPIIAAGLRQLGAEVSQVEAYRTGGAPLDIAGCRDWIAREAVGAVTFTSPSAVDELARALGAADFAQLLSSAAPVAIGRTTARALSARGHHAVVASSATLAGVAATTLRVMQSRS
jgi:uroporphyrinogen III methyltransferase / synthase